MRRRTPRNFNSDLEGYIGVKKLQIGYFSSPVQCWKLRPGRQYDDGTVHGTGSVAQLGTKIQKVTRAEIVKRGKPEEPQLEHFLSWG